VTGSSTSLIPLVDYRWLIGPEAARWFEAVTSTDGRSLVQLVQRLRRDLPPGRAHLLIEQIELRRRGREKFPHAQRMFFTRRGLEQSTDAWVAVYKASRFPPAAPLADLCCGIGGDLLALAARGTVCAVDRDPLAVLLAEANLRACLDQQPPLQFEAGEVTNATAELARRMAAWHIDPDRRPAGRRTTRVQLHDPDPEVLRRLLSACPSAAVKLAPAATLSEPWWTQAELEWISRSRQCRQLVAWFGGLAHHPGQRRATVLESCATFKGYSPESRVLATFVGTPGRTVPIASRIGRYVFEPDAAVLAAKLDEALAADQNLLSLAGGVAYFTSDQLADHPALARFEVLEAMPYRVKTLREWLAARGIGRLEVKKRGVPLEPEKVRRELQVEGALEATLLLARIRGQMTAIIAQRT